MLMLPDPEGTLTRLAREVFGSEHATESSWDGALYPGARVGRFELVREIGRGGFGTVWEAIDVELKRRVAFKAVRARVRSQADERALSEAEVAAHLSHPNVVTLFDLGRCEHGTYLVLELLRGRSLREVVREDGPLAPAQAARIGAQVARGLAHAHARGVLHRDLTPSNVFVCEDGEVKLLDLGLSRVLAREGSPVDGHAGTPGYAPPERRRGEPEDARGDLYGLGAVLRLMLIGKRPDAVPDGGVASAPVPGPPELTDLVVRLLDDDPGKRPATASEVQRELERIAGAAPGAPRRRSAARVGAGIALAGLLVAAAAMFFVAPRRFALRPPDGGLAVAIAQPILAVGQTTTATAKPSVGAKEGFPSPSWITSDPRVASVDSDGRITARAPGTAHVTAFSRGLEGSGSVVVQGPEWQLAFTSTLAPPPDGWKAHFAEVPEGQGVARAWGRDAWLQRARNAVLSLPARIPEGTDLVAVQVDVRVPASGAGERSVGVFVAGDATRVGNTGELLELAAADRWHTIRLEGSRARCSGRVLVDGDLIGETDLGCGGKFPYVNLVAMSEGVAAVDAAWSSLRVFRATPVDRVDIAIRRLEAGGDTHARAIALLTDAQGNPLPGRTIDWSSSDPEIARIDSTGAVFAGAPGEVTITARCEGKEASGRLRIPPGTAARP